MCCGSNNRKYERQQRGVRAQWTGEDSLGDVRRIAQYFVARLLIPLLRPLACPRPQSHTQPSFFPLLTAFFPPPPPPLPLLPPAPEKASLFSCFLKKLPSSKRDEVKVFLCFLFGRSLSSFFLWVVRILLVVHHPGGCALLCPPVNFIARALIISVCHF